MKSQDNETLIVIAGIGVLAISLLLPMAQKFAAEHDVSEVATRAVEVKEKLLSSTEPGKPLRVRVSDLVDGLSPDAAHATAEMRAEGAVKGEAEEAVKAEDDVKPEAVAVVARPDHVGEDDEAVAAAPQVAERRDEAPAVAPRDSADGVHQTKRPGAAWIWEQ